MAQPAQQLPAEIWVHVFGYLSASDKFSVRTACKYFKKLIDHGSLWKDWSVVLGFHKGYYNSQFWGTLRRRRVTSVVLRGTKATDLKRLASSIPTLTTVVTYQSSQASLGFLKECTNLKRLAIRGSGTPLLLDGSTVYEPKQLTHLSMCDVKLPTTAVSSLISAVVKFKNLTSLVCHKVGIIEDTFLMVHSILTCLPKLKHLSLSVGHTLCTFHNNSRPNPGPLGGDDAPVLSSLELIDCMDYSFEEDVMKRMPGLKSLAVFYNHSHHRIPGGQDGGHLKTWLRDLSQLSTLVIVKGPPVKNYVTSIPATVTSLTLCIAGLSPQDMEAVSVQVPNLLHLHIDPWPSHLGAHAAQIPQLFPKLKSLKLRHEHVSEKDFLQLHQLKDLEYLEILDIRPHLSELTGKLQALTNVRLQVITSPRNIDVLTCPCVCQVN
ncbi:hypothetical protein PBY51_013480 [Eleginops maclovinus]|uniref:F-box domain-containing protein n=1 Tax=Eleginops maclovinus TaxID=56733 RepID=A0AAN8AUH5_ELEMC|nr:hypothetical protein PBY51_013480 [Eleginops maclovinus]